MEFEIAIYNGGCDDGRTIINSVKAAYLYADKVRIYDYSIPTGFQMPEILQEYKKNHYNYIGHCRAISFFNEDEEAYLKLGFNSSADYVIDFLNSYVECVLTTQIYREQAKEYNRANYEKMLAKLDIEIIEPKVVLPETGVNVMKRFGEFINNFENDKGLKMFTNVNDTSDGLEINKNLLSSYLSEYAISKLPGFENASLDEMKDIRNELDGYIIPYRKAIIKTVETIKEIPDSESLQQECAKLYLEEIEPKVAAINAAIHDNNVFKNIARSAFTSELAWTGIGSIAVAISTRANIANATALGSALALCGYSVSNGIKTTLEKEKEIQKNEMYFLYEAGNILETEYS